MKQGIGGHQSARAETTTWLTPRFVIDALGGSESFDLDPCSAPDPKLWPTARRHYTAPADDGLRLPWAGRVWLNPPYGRELGTWLKRLADHGRGTGLCFARTETVDFFDAVWERAHGLLFLKGRLTFHLPDGSLALANGGAPSVLCAYGADDLDRLAESGLDGQIVPLRRLCMIAFAARDDDAVDASWRDLVLDALRAAGGSAPLASLYAAIDGHPKTRANPNWKAKIRQTVGRCGKRTSPSQYALAI